MLLKTHGKIDKKLILLAIDSKNTVTHFREYVPSLENNYKYYKDMPTWKHIYRAQNEAYKIEKTKKWEKSMNDRELER